MIHMNVARQPHLVRCACDNGHMFLILQLEYKIRLQLCNDFLISCTQLCDNISGILIVHALCCDAFHCLIYG